MDLPFDELQGWMEYFRRRPVGWRADNRAAIIAMSSLGGSKLKPEDLFESLRTIKNEAKITEEQGAGNKVAQKFLEKFGNKFSEKVPFLDAKV